jgi:chromosome segregation protein SMC, common bacterial type
MYLKSIEIHGFKSFANKLLFEFRDGITAIVGPNGSGKSNVADAVRWVLGEQSAKQLRGAKMEDIIFQGTEARKALGFAYVAITLDNSDHKLATSYEEVTVARRVYRSGESEYLINGTNCRLRDVQELFLDTGIGKEGYSIIGQGQIDKILSGKPEERRELFDEAAGIVKFKKRKAAAEKNLEEERQNLCRINDILSEIEKQIAPLEKQSVVAREYLKYRDELKVLDVNMFLVEYDRIHENLNQMEEKIQIADLDLQKTKISYENTKEEYDRLELQMEEHNSSLEEAKSQLSDNRVKKEQLEGQIKVLNEQIIAARQNDEHFKTRVEAVNNSVISKKEELNQYLIKKQEIDEKIASLNEKRGEEEQQLSDVLNQIEKISQSIVAANRQNTELVNENSVIKTKMQRFETMLEQNNIQKVSLNQRLLKNKSEEAVCEDTIQIEQNRLEKVSGQITLFKQTIEELEKQIGETDRKISSYRTEYNNRQQEFHREKSKLDSLKNITERYEGYGQSIRRVMEQKEDNAGIIGVVADIIKVKKQYETAVEIALGGNIQNIVTTDEATAKQFIQFLKQNKYGRATFLPLTSISSKNSGSFDQVLKETGVIGIGSSLVEADDQFDKLIQYLLGRIIVVDQIDHAIALAKKYNHTLRIVTLDGELLNPGGSMSGGAYKNSSNLLSRRREMQDIEHHISQLEADLNQLEQKISLEKESKSNQLECITDNKQQLQELFIQQNTAKLKYEQALESKKNNQDILNQIAKENSGIDGQIKEYKTEIQKLKELLDENEAGMHNNLARLEECNASLVEKQKEESIFREKDSKFKIDFSALDQNNQFISENIARVKRELTALNDDMVALEHNMSNSVSQIYEKEQEILLVKTAIQEFTEAAEALEEKIKQIVLLREELSKSHKEFFSKREELSSRINDLDKECFRLNSQKEKLSEQLDSQQNYMWDEYELTYQSACSLKTESEQNPAQMKKITAELKTKIKNLGDVNINAIEDYKALTERYDLLRTQQNDLVKAEEVLRKIINELDEEMRKQFEQKFKEIRQQFDLVFKELFGGGKGTLELMEEEDILEAGIRIIAQPPGKKLQNMMQLSGGEKALTAIALLFAIQNLKPSPFCLLDEIEAALDDSNVTRYAKYLHKLTKDTQFIVITHRRGTMEAADILYGITMQEKGVSTLVSVNLIENQLDE